MTATLLYSITARYDRAAVTMLKHLLYLPLADWSNWQKVTLQYLDANNKVVSTQVAVPSEWELVKTPCL